MKQATLRLTLVAIAALIVTARPGLSADLEQPTYKAPPPAAASPAYNWTGFYVGGNAGGAWANFGATTVVASPGTYFGAVDTIPAINAAGAQSISPAGFIGGFEVGYNFQSGWAAFGIEGDIEYMHLSGGKSSSGVFPCCAPAVFTVTSSARANWLSTIRGRLGYAADDWLFFATGGVAFTDVKATFSYADNCGDILACNAGALLNGVETPVSFRNEKVGYAVGGGVEKAISAKWTVKAEYLYVDISSASANGLLVAPSLVGPTLTAPLIHSIDLRANIVRLGANFRF